MVLNSGNSRHWFLLALLPKQFQIPVLDSTAGSLYQANSQKNHKDADVTQ